MEFTERYDLTKVQYLAGLTIGQLKAHLGTCKNDEERRNKFNILQTFCSGIIKNRGLVIRQYCYSLSTPLESGGRLFCGSSIQGKSKFIRGFLVADRCTDIDMKNAHPVILSYICRRHGIHAAELNNYIANRDAILSTFDDREKGKKLYLTSVNSEKVLRDSNPAFKRFDREMKDIQKQLILIPEYRDIKDSVPEDKRVGNFNGSAVNRILCMYENKILQAAMSFLNRKGIEIFSPMFDGVLVYGDIPSDIISDLQSSVEEVFPGLGMEWVRKPIVSDIIIPADYVMENFHARSASNDMEAAEMVLKDLTGRLVYSQGSFFMKKDNIWCTGEKEVRSLVELTVLKSQIGRLDKDGNLTAYTQNHRNAVAIAACVMKLQMEKQDDKWLDAVFSSSFGYVLFENGYFNFKQGRFVQNESPDFNHEIVFMEHIPFKYDETVFTGEQLKYVHDTVFGQQFAPDIAEYYKLQLARGLAGDCMKRFLIGIGPSNSGKSTITACLAASCGGYFDGFSAANAAIKPFITDEAQAARWLYLLRFKRIIVSNELTTHIKLDGNTLKKLSNGGLDTLVGRFHHGNETKFKVGFLPIIFANDLPKISPYDDAVDNRLRSIPYTKIYASKPSNEFELKANESLDKEIEQPWFRMAFLTLLFQSYTKFQEAGRVEVEPADILKSKRDVVGEESSLVKRFLNDYEITGNPDDCIKSSDIQKWIDDNKLGVTMTRFGREINRYCQIEKIEGVFSKTKKVDGKGLSHWFGCRDPSVLKNPKDCEL